MKTANVKFETTDQIIRFVNIVEQYGAEIDLKNGSCIVDAKSLMGVLSFGISKPLEMVVFSENCDKLMEKIDFCIVA